MATSSTSSSTGSSTTSFPSASLYVGDLVPDATEAILFEIFNAVGPVASVRVCRDAATRRSLGYAYVNFHRPDDAEKAMAALNFTEIRGRPCRIMWSHRDPSLRKSGIGNIFVKQLAKSIDNRTLYDTFSIFGSILSCKVARNPKGDSLGYGFVHFESEEAAQQAITKVDGKIIAGQKVSVAAFKSKREREAKMVRFTNLYVKNLPLECTKEQLEELFSKYGPITSVMVAASEDGKSRGFGFVNFENAEHANAALEALNNYKMGDKQLYVGRAQKKEERERELRVKFEKLRLERQAKYQSGTNLYVKNIPETWDEKKLRDEFSRFGSITSCRVMREAGKSKGFGFVSFSAPEEATEAVTGLNQSMVEGKPLYVALAQKKEQRRAEMEHRSRLPHPAAAPHLLGGNPMFYGQRPGAPFMYPAAGGRGWVPMPGQAPMMRPGMYPYPMPGMLPQQPPRANGQAGGGRGRRQPGAQQPRVVYEQTAQNVPGRAPNGPAAPAPAAAAAAAAPNGQKAPAAAPLQLTMSALAALPEKQKKQVIGEQLFIRIRPVEPRLAGKITGMLLEMDNGELISLLESEAALKEKIDEAKEVLKQHEAAAAAGATAPAETA